MTEIIEYVREKRNGRIRKVGVLLGTSVNYDDVRIGWSKVMLRKKGKDMDAFDKERGLMIARSRRDGHGKSVQVPNVIKKRLPQFKSRCLRYFKKTKLSKTADEL